MKIQYYVATSLDGFIADSQNSLDWLFQFGGPGDGGNGHSTSYSNFIREVGAIAMGSTTYEWILTHQIEESADHKQSWVYEQPTWVFTSQILPMIRTLPMIEGANIQFVKGDVRPVHRAMMAAAGNKNIWLVGGGDLVGQFYDHGLLNEIIVSIAPVTLGSGAPLLPRTITTPPLKLLSSTVHGAAFVELRYEVPER
jgi:dihydrofolate reductase